MHEPGESVPPYAAKVAEPARTVKGMKVREKRKCFISVKEADREESARIRRFQDSRVS